MVCVKYVRWEIELGLQEAETGPFYTQEEAEAMILGWTIEKGGRKSLLRKPCLCLCK